MFYPILIDANASCEHVKVSEEQIVLRQLGDKLNISREEERG